VAADKEEFFRSFDPPMRVDLFFCDADHRRSDQVRPALG
jgi:hypothetical protein